MTGEDEVDDVVFTANDEVLLVAAAATTRIVGLRFGGHFYRLGWVAIQPGESMPLALAQLLRAVAGRLEEIDTGS
jgi:hypothetical protein